MKIAIAQLNPIVGDLKGNAAQILAVAERAAAAEARLLLTPELSLCGYPPRDLLLNPGFIGAMEEVLLDLAQTLPPQLAVLVGIGARNPTAEVTGNKPLFNSVVWLEAGRIKTQFHKQLLPTYDVFDEDRYFAPGQSDNVMVLDGVRIGISVCEDLWNEESFWGKRIYRVNPISQLAGQSVDFIVNLSASPFCVGKQTLRESMLNHTAQQYDCPIVYVNQVGGNDDLIFDGRSLVVNHQGDILARGQAFATDLVWVDYDSDGHQIKSGHLPAHPAEATAEIWCALVLGVRDYARKCGFKQVVLGLSGGIDSALVAAIAAEALGAENVLGVLMPSPYSSDHSITDALALAANLGVETQTIPIAPLMEGFAQSLAPLFVGTESGLAEENIQARIRGNLLMAIANKFGRLLISTGNKSEVAVGYCTLYGDMSGGLAAIADVPKTTVYKLCEWLNSPAARAWVKQLTPNAKGEIVPAHIITKPPSAELKPGQLDRDSLPPYDVLDDILYRYIDEHQSQADIVAGGRDAAIVSRVLSMVKRAEFKRQQAAPGLKITDRAFGTGWRMPIASQWEMSNETC
ncbi:NAD+ synthase [Altericista sp. CCNU0014]|uniref:NAD+ synthase n=1 Tax=Altericista sp. CCNU0014 TaxID=3082949 RepID=UPI00384F694D